MIDFIHSSAVDFLISYLIPRYYMLLSSLTDNSRVSFISFYWLMIILLSNSKWILSHLNPRTYKEARGWMPTPIRFFFKFFPQDKTSVPDVFSSCSFIPRAHFETSLVMVSCYGKEIWRRKLQVVQPIWGENTCLFNFFQQ